MRKRTIKNIADQLFWLIVALMPLVVFLVQHLAYELTSAADALPSFLEFMQGFGISTDSIVYSVLADLFGFEGIMPFFTQDNNTVLLFMSYFVTVQIVHLAVDFILFIPRLCHKWMETFTSTEA